MSDLPVAIPPAGAVDSPARNRYATVKRENIRKLIEQYAADPDPLNILPELAASRALFQDFIERYDEWREAFLAWHASFAADSEAVKPRQVMDVADAYRLLDGVSRIVERIEKVRAQNAISRPDLLRVMTEMGRVVQAHVSDPDTLERIKRDWLNVRV